MFYGKSYSLSECDSNTCRKKVPGGCVESVSIALGLSASGIILDEDMTIHHTRQLWNQKHVSLIHVVSSRCASHTSLWGDLNTIGSTAGRLLTAQSLSEVSLIYGQYSAHVVPVRETSFPPPGSDFLWTNQSRYIVKYADHLGSMFHHATRTEGNWMLLDPFQVTEYLIELL